MSYFSAALDNVMRERSLTQKDLSQKSGVPQGQLSRYLEASARPKTDGLERLCAAVGDAGVGLAIAFLKDEIPNALKDRIHVLAAARDSATSPSAAPSVIDKLPQRTRRLIEDAARECERRPEFVAALESTLALTRSIESA